MTVQPLTDGRGFARKAIALVIVVLMLAVTCINSVATPGDAKLGEQARRAIGQWSDAQQADHSWEWARILAFLVQIALSAQGFDPGKADGLMGPNTMMALLSWRSEKGEPIAIDLNPSLGIADIVAQLLYVTLESMGLSPGPRDQILGRESTTALEHWGDTFTWGALSMDIGAPEVARKTVMEGFGQAPSSAAEEAGKDRSPNANVGQDGAAGDNSSKDADRCLEFAWKERVPVTWGSVRADDPQMEAQSFGVRNTCDFRIWFAFKDNGLAFDPAPGREGFLYRPLTSSCDLADDQQARLGGSIMDRKTVDQSGPHFPLNSGGGYSC